MKPSTRHNVRVFTAAVAVSAACVAGLYAAEFGGFEAAYIDYEPTEGDVVFQSLPRNAVVDAIEGVSGSPFSHCGIVAREDGRWVVYEAFDGVERTPLREFLTRGRKRGFAVYRFVESEQEYVAETLANVRTYLGRPYDNRYRMDDAKIYCSELIFKAYRTAAGRPLGTTDRLGDLNWRPHADVIRLLEGGPVPLDREMITPKALAAAPQLKPAYAFAIVAE